jgi:hypothetical protein
MTVKGYPMVYCGSCKKARLICMQLPTSKEALVAALLHM